MKINHVGSVSSYNSVTPEKTVKISDNESKPCSADRVEISIKPTVNDVETKIKENILRADKQKITQDKLEALKQKISQNNYYVDTADIVKSIL